MNIHTDVCHFERTADYLGYEKFTRSDSQTFGGVQLPAFIYKKRNLSQLIFEVSNTEFYNQPVFSMHIVDLEGFEGIEIKWIGIKALLAFATKDLFVDILYKCLNAIDAKDYNSENLIFMLKDIDHTFVTPDIYLDHK